MSFIIKTLILIFYTQGFGQQASYASRLNIEDVIRDAVIKEVHKECRTCRVELTLFNRKILDDIMVPDQILADHWKGQVNLVLQIGSENRIVTANIRWFDQVVIARDNLKIGDLLSHGNSERVEMDVTYLQVPYAREVSKVNGLQAKRLMRRGQIIDESALKKPIVVRFGQPIKVELNDGSLQVVLDAKAQGAGAVGDDIPILVPRTGKRINGKIIDSGRVIIE